MSKSLILSVLVCGMSIFYSAVPRAEGADPSVHEIYAAAEAGHIGQAEQMVDQVLKDNPRSGKAHYVAAEIYARAGNFARSRAELSSARQIDPGLSFANPTAVSALDREVNASHGLQTAPVYAPAARAHGGLPWGTIIFVVLAIGLVWSFVRRRVAMSSYGGSPIPPGPGQPGYGASPMGGPMGGPYYPGGGGGSGLMGSLGTGLAVGAGVAVGEELIHHVLDRNDSGGVISNAGAGEREYAPPENGNMGGDNFGINDGGSWNNDGGGDGGSFDSSVGGDDWT